MKKKYRFFAKLFFTFSLITLLFLSGCATGFETKEALILKKGQENFNNGRKLLEEGKIHEAEISFHESLKIAEEQGYRQGAILNYEMLGVASLSKKDYASSIRHLQMALKLSTEADSKLQSASILNILGKTYLEKGDHSKALIYFNQSLDVDAQSGNLLGIGVTHNNIGRLHFITGNNKLAINHYLNAIEIFTTLKDKVRAQVVITNIRLLNNQ